MSNYGLENVPTCALVKELSGRAGVERIDIEPYSADEIKVEGPAIVFVVID